MPTKTATHYTLLGVQPSASEQEIKKAYLKLVRVHHPDRGTGAAGEAMTKRLNEAQDILLDPVTREEYDQSLREPAPEPQQARTAGGATATGNTTSGPWTPAPEPVKFPEPPTRNLRQTLFPKGSGELLWLTGICAFLAPTIGFMISGLVWLINPESAYPVWSAASTATGTILAGLSITLFSGRARWFGTKFLAGAGQLYMGMTVLMSLTGLAFEWWGMTRAWAWIPLLSCILWYLAAFSANAWFQLRNMYNGASLWEQLIWRGSTFGHGPFQVSETDGREAIIEHWRTSQAGLITAPNLVVGQWVTLGFDGQVNSVSPKSTYQLWEQAQRRMQNDADRAAKKEKASAEA